MMLERLLQLWMIRGVRHFWQGFGQQSLGMKQIP